MFDTVAEDVPFAFACLATTDPANGLINAAYKSHPLPVGDQEFAASEYGGPDINQFVELAGRQPPVGLLSVDTGGEPMLCRRLREYMAPQFGFTDELRLVCRGPQLTWGLLALYRAGGEPSFTPADGRLVASLHEAISDGVRRVLFAGHPSPIAGAGTPVVMVLDGEDRVTDMSTATDTVIEELGGWDHGSLPASAMMVAASSRSLRAPAEAQVPASSGRWFKVRAMPLGEGPTGAAVVLTIERADPAVVGQMAIAARGLTVREQEVVALVLQGASTKDIASRLYLSPHTVQDHLKAIFAKLEVSSRRELVGQFILT
ncbi:response regulator transcription factor [uncultured Friedmanniella sp.]|uniref:response regulator transcription factor n=1 Tax=uncultured Friedmanniella sp. TaxID=335381 RepID=UPI0035CA2F7F